jgi:ATP-dependent Clp protease ATP-binding subunit ClpC
MTIHVSMELRQVLAEAEDIATQVSQNFCTTHLLLGLFTVDNRAKILLEEKGLNEDVLLENVHIIREEPPKTIRLVKSKASEIATGCHAQAIDCLHLLIAMCGLRQTAAYELLSLSGLSVAQFRNTALSYVTTALPRRLTIKKRSGTDQLHKNLGAKGSFQQAQPVHSAPPAVLNENETRPEIGITAPQQNVMAEDGTPDELPKNAWDLESAYFPQLSKLGRNLSSEAAEGRIDPLIGRKKELTQVIDTLLKRRANNPLLVGEPGVGKTAIVEGLALHIVQGNQETKALSDRRVIELDVASLLAGTQLRGAFSEKLQQIREEVKAAQGSVVVFFDEMHTLIGAGSTGDGPQDAANELKAALARGEFPCIGATTHDEYRRFIESDPALTRRFQLIQVPEPSLEDTVEILKGIADEYAEHHGVRYDQAAIETAVRLSSRYITDRCLPDKAISLLDLAGSRAQRSGRKKVDREAIARVVSSVADIPVERLLATDSERFLNMEQILGLQIIGHSAVMRAIANVIRRNYAGFTQNRPIASLLFLGPTGVGKTESARALAHFLFSHRDAMVKLDMSEYTEPHAVARMLGSPPGYVGHQEGGQLTEAVRRKPYTIVLFDEVEKAHLDVQQVLLQIMDEGRLTDAKGRTVDFTNTVVIMTTNLGAEALGRPNSARIGFGQKTQPATSQAKDVLGIARQGFPPELWGRMDEHLYFRQLTSEDLVAIAALVLKDSLARLEKERDIRVTPDPIVASHIVESSCQDHSLGARPIRAAIRRFLEEPLAEAILQKRFTSGDRIRVSLSNNSLRFSLV